MTWWTYVESVASTTRQRDVADRTGIDETNVTRWKAGQIPKPPMVAQFARAYRRPVLEAFIAAGFLTADEAKQRPSAPPSLEDLSDEELVSEVLARMKGARNETQESRSQTQRAPEQSTAAMNADEAAARAARREWVGDDPVTAPTSDAKIRRALSESGGTNTERNRSAKRGLRGA